MLLRGFGVERRFLRDLCPRQKIRRVQPMWVERVEHVDGADTDGNTERLQMFFLGIELGRDAGD